MNPKEVIMKILFAFLILSLSAFSFAAADENFCNGKSSCIKGYIPLLKSGTYHARGIGMTCKAAMDFSRNRFFNEYGNMSCGLISGPYVWSCTKLSDNKYSAWTKCNPDSGPSRSARRSRCAMIGGVLVC